MSKWGAIFLFFITLIMVLFSTIFWEFVLEPFLKQLEDSAYQSEAFNDRWEFVVTSFTTAMVALIIPFFLLYRFIVKEPRNAEVSLSKRQNEEVSLTWNRYFSFFRYSCKNNNTFPLAQYFSAISAIAILGFALVAVLTLREFTSGKIIEIAEHQNVLLAKTFQNSIWPRFSSYLTSVKDTDGDILRSKPETQKISDAVKILATGLPVLKVKIYNLSGSTLYSSQAKQIGEKNHIKEPFQVARNGANASEMTFRSSFISFENEVYERFVVASYIPIQATSGDVEGVFELYTDVTEIKKSIETAMTQIGSWLFLAFALLWGFLFLVVQYADGVLKSQDKIRRKAEEERTTAMNLANAANQAKSEFLASMSHDLRTPLNAILGFAEILSHQYLGPIDEKYQEYARDIHSSGEHLLGMVNDILDLSTIEAGGQPLVKENLHIQKIISECVKLIDKKANSSDITLIIDASDSLPSLYADRRATKQILINLLSNAVKFTPNGGKIKVSAEGLKRNIIFKVTDTGKGIPTEKLSNLTDPFIRAETDPYRSEQGWGLGLSITKSLVELHDGTMDIKSTVGKGTTVTVTLPNTA